MKLNSHKLNIKQIVKQIVFGVSASLLLTSNVVAYEEAKNTLAIEAGSENRTELSLEREKPVIVAQLYNYCYGGESMFVAAETRGFWVNICGGRFSPELRRCEQNRWQHYSSGSERLFIW